MRVGQVAGHINLMGFHLFEQLLYDGHIGFAHGILLYLAALIEGQVEEVDMRERNTVVGAGRACLAAADEALDGEHIFCIDIAFFLLGEESLYFLVLAGNDEVALLGEELVEAVDEVHEAGHLLIAHGNVAGGLISHMHIMALLHESAQGATHGDDIIIRMR